MKKLLALACATSALALCGSAAASADSYALHLTGTIGPVCAITATSGVKNETVPLTPDGNGGFQAIPATTSSGLTVTGNGKCAVTPTTANGGLRGAATNATVIPYTAYLTGGAHAAAPLTVGGIGATAPNTAGATVDTIGSTLATGNGYSATVNYALAASGVVPADTYTDTLTVTVNPSA